MSGTTNPFGDLAGLERWVAWRPETRGGRLTKVPYAPDGRRSKAGDPSTWGSRSAAEHRAKKLINGQGGGVGLQLGDCGSDIYLAGVDLDSCLAVDGSITGWAEDIINVVRSYAEISPSGTGIKIFFYIGTEDVRWFLDRIGAACNSWGCKRGIPGLDSRNHGAAVEIYTSHRFFAVTGQHWSGSPQRLRLLDQAALNGLAALTPPAKTKVISRVDSTGGGDTSRSAAAFRKGRDLVRQGYTFEKMCDALRRDSRAADWVREKGEAYGGRELRRMWEHIGVSCQVPEAADTRAPEFSDEALALRFAEKHLSEARYI